MEILKYVDQLEEIVDTAAKVPLTGKVMAVSYTHLVSLHL